MTKDDFESELDVLVDRALATVAKGDVIASLEYMISEIRAGGFGPSLRNPVYRDARASAIG